MKRAFKNGPADYIHNECERAILPETNGAPINSAENSKQPVGGLNVYVLIFFFT